MEHYFSMQHLSALCHFDFQQQLKDLLSLFITIYPSFLSQKLYLSIAILNLILLSTEYWPCDKSFDLIHFFVTNFVTVGSFNNLDIFFVFHFYDTCVNLFNISSLFVSRITISSTFLEFLSSTSFGFTICFSDFFSYQFSCSWRCFMNYYFGSSFSSILSCVCSSIQ